jgi:hypothetical protein
VTLLLALLAVLGIAFKRRERRAKRERDTNPPLETEDPCPEFTDEELWSWGFSSRADFRAAELRHYAQTAYDDSGPDDGRMMRPLRPPYQFPPQPRGSTRVRRPVRHASRSRRSPRRARPSRRARSASQASADPEPAPGCPASRDLREGGQP